MTAEIIHGDALDVLRALPSASADAIVTDPPYASGGVSEASRSSANGQGLRSENLTRFGWFVGDNMGTAGLVYLLRSMAFEAIRIARPSASMLMFCDWRQVPNLAPAIESAGWRYQGLIVWDKGAMGLGNGFRCQHEMILHFTAGAPEYYDKGTPNVLTCGRIRGDDRLHQTEKPVDLLRRLLRVVCPPGGVVLDPFAGSGSTGVAALAEGMRFIGIERALEHVETARRRLSGEEVRPVPGQRSLFGGP